MAQPSRRSTLIDYCKRQLGAPLLEINIADEQTEDLLDDAIQYFQERHFNGVIQTFLKYKVRQVDIDRARGRGGDNAVGIVTTTTSATIVGVIFPAGTFAPCPPPAPVTMATLLSKLMVIFISPSLLIP